MMKKKILLASLIFLFVILFVAFVRLNPKNDSGITRTVGTGSVSQNTTISSFLVTSSELITHNSQSDCWVAYDGKVYDITSFLPNHPGGIDRILPYCGTADEFQNAFTKQHGISKVKMLMTVGVLMGDFEVKGNTNG